jgi:hypothetical protein
MASPKPAPGSKPKHVSVGLRALAGMALKERVKQPVHASVLEEARVAGLLDGEKSEHVSFRAPPALVEAAKRESGVSSTSELGMLALAMLAQPDPVAAFLKRTRGRLGRDHRLDC